jgi:hypothetical protein
MDSRIDSSNSLIQSVIAKSCLKQEIFQQTLEVFRSFKQESEGFVKSHKSAFRKAAYPLEFDYNDQGEFLFQLKFGSDILIFFMHSNIFEIPRDHLVMKSSYIREDKNRSYCGIIHIFNFLSDSFKYNRTSDVGYCIARIFINREKHYFTEGKREIGLLYNNFQSSLIDRKTIQNILHSAIDYTINFDLLTPPFESIKEITVNEIQSTLDTMSIKTGKRLGFRFQADELQVKTMQGQPTP